MFIFIATVNLIKNLKISKLTEICSTYFCAFAIHPQEQQKETKMLQKFLPSWDHRQAMRGRVRDDWTRNSAGKLPWWGSKLCLRFSQLPGRVSQCSVWGKRELTLGISPWEELNQDGLKPGLAHIKRQA